MRTLLVVALCAAAVAAQEPQGPTFKTGVDLIAIDVAVVDGQGRPIEDLRAPDFAVKIDGQERRIVSAELFKVNVEDARRQAEDKTETFFTSNLTPPNARMIVIAIDQTNIHPGAIKPILSAASTFLDQLSPLDEVAFVAYPEPGPRVNFTTDRLKVRLAMQQLVGQPQLGTSAQVNLGLAEALAIENRRDQIVLADLLFAAIAAQYEVARGGQALSSTDRAKLRRYATAYRGPQRALVDKYLETLQVR